MPSKPEKKNLLELEKIVKKIIRKSLKDNTLDYTIQISVSNADPEKVKYAAMISSPAKGVQPITFIFNSHEELKVALEEAVNEVNRDKVEKTFHQYQIESLENRIQAHKARIVQIDNPEEEEDEDIEMEEV